MNAYDFDQTIFYPDSSYCFVKYCLKKYPKAVIPAIPGSIKELIVYLRRHHGAKNLKQKMFSFLPRLGDADAVIRDFWDEYRGNLEPWYLAQKRPDDIIISASPEFLPPSDMRRAWRDAYRHKDGQGNRTYRRRELP